MSTCSIDECSRVAVARGWCDPHYRRWKKHGDPLHGRIRTDVQPIDRFMVKVEIPGEDECWTWTGYTNESGYGRFAEGGRLWLAHRWSYTYFVGPIPEGLELDHTCHTDDASCRGGVTCPHRRCVNPMHLEPVTGDVNTERGRSGQHWAERTSCPQGHPYDHTNTYEHRGKRYCRTCVNAAGRKWRAKRKART